MNLEKFKILHKTFLNHLDKKEIMKSNEYDLYMELLHENKDYFEWTLKDNLLKAKFNFSQFCCMTMASRIFESLDAHGEIETKNKDVVMRKWKNGTYGIPIHDGGSSIIKINYCPWCRNKLKK